MHDSQKWNGKNEQCFIFNFQMYECYSTQYRTWKNHFFRSAFLCQIHAWKMFHKNMILCNNKGIATLCRCLCPQFCYFHFEQLNGIKKDKIIFSKFKLNALTISPSCTDFFFNFCILETFLFFCLRLGTRIH